MSERSSAGVDEGAIRELLALCSKKNVEVPIELKEKLLQIGRDHPPSRRHRNVNKILEERHAEQNEVDSKVLREVREVWEKLGFVPPKYELLVKNGSYAITHPKGNQDGMQIETVGNANPCYQLAMAAKQLFQGECKAEREMEESLILDDVNLRFESGKLYLVVGAPGSGKSTLLRMIANTLTQDKQHVVGGSVSINGVSPSDKNSDVVWTNLVSYSDQIDRLHPYLTVSETCEFAWRCRSASTHMVGALPDDDARVQAIVKELDDEHFTVNKTLDVMGLTRVKDTFVGDQSTVRGVSGGEKKRVTVSEIAVMGTPVVCYDEISTGLDAATTYDITRAQGAVVRLTGSIFIVSLLQPPPETVSLFDELILVDKGKVLYSGPMDQVVNHFGSVGYSLPERLDMAEWLLKLVTGNGKKYRTKEKDHHHLSATEFKERFYHSGRGRSILESINAPILVDGIGIDDEAKLKYRSSSLQSLKLLVERETLLWWRDKYGIISRVMQDAAMGIVTGTLFWQSDDPTSIVGVLFQAMLFVAMGSMARVPSQFSERSILYKHQDANLFPTWTYVVARTIAFVPTALFDSVVFGSMIYWFVGLAYNDGASVANFFVFLLLIFIGSLGAAMMFSMFSAILPDIASAQSGMGILVVLLLLFSGFTVQANVIPNYWVWFYWLNLFAWVLRGLAVNEFDSGKYDEVTLTGLTLGEELLTRFGFTLDDEPFTFEWTWWGILFSLAVGLVSLLVTNFFLTSVRYETGKSLAAPIETDISSETNATSATAGGPDTNEESEKDTIKLDFQRVNMTFKDIHYTVTASTSKEQLELLKGIDGLVEAGKMTALMGSSGAGKTTLMDVLTLRKTSGVITGEVRLNGCLQESNSFRRCAGYVEQFDTQSPQLTIRETVLFSASLRLGESDPVVTQKFVDQTLAILELTNIEHLQVGSDLTGGLSFEQRKRLSIAVELAANPSIIFLDEPTSGLDARAAAMVMRALRRIASTGRAVCATIHQPSISIFYSFDALLLLKRGGETVFFGDLGRESVNLINYLEAFEATPPIQPGENPATWMLTTLSITAGPSLRPFDYAGNYAASELHEDCLRRINLICSNCCDEEKISFPTLYATSRGTQQGTLLRRTMKLYWRNTGYNLSRLMVSIILALIFGSVYVSQRVPKDESDMSSRVTTIYMGTVFLGVISFNAVLDVFEIERNMYYHHKDARMYDEKSIILAFTVAEIPFVLVSVMIFQVIFYFMVGLSNEIGKFFYFYLFLVLNTGLMTMLGQMVLTLVRNLSTAQGLGSVIHGMVSLFTGILIRPQNISNFWIFAYWLLPGHYVLEGLLMSQFDGDVTTIQASPGTPFWEAENCTARASGNPDFVCTGTAENWILANFGEFFTVDHIPWNILYLVAGIVVSRVITYVGLVFFNFRST